MGRATGISWTRSTRNFWSGCTKIGPGCDGCYAEAFNRFTRGKSEATGQAVNWGPGAPRFPHLEGAAKDLRKWNGICAWEREHGRVAEKDKSGWSRPGFWPVFLNSHSDFFDNEVSNDWRWHAYPVIEEVTNLELFLVTKRVGNVAKMVPERWMRDGFPEHVRLIITVVNQEEADRDIPKLLALPCRNGVSYEPAVAPVDWTRISLGTSPARVSWSGDQQFRQVEFTIDGLKGSRSLGWRGLQWIIVGGESHQAGHQARPMRIEWARNTLAQCRAAGVAFFMKQLGTDYAGLYERVIKDRAGADPAEWPEDLRVQEFPA